MSASSSSGLPLTASAEAGDSMPPCSGLALEGVHKSYESAVALAGVSLCVPKGSIIAVLGPSGSGKSTLLSVIAGLEPPDAGRILWEGDPLEDVPTHQRGFGLMFQDFALFPHLNVGRNVAFGLEMQRLAPEDVTTRVRECLAQVGLAGFEDRDVGTLSGGEQQRVALARALAPRPRLLMLDEPLGALDRTLRERLLGEIHRILRSTRQTALVVTHDQEEAFGLADRVVILEAGRILQQGEPQQVYRHPASAAVARFLGLNNLLPGEAATGGTLTALGLLPVHPARGPRCTVLLRPESARPDGQGGFQFDALLLDKTFRGQTCTVVVEAHGLRLGFELPSSTPLPPEGGSLHLALDLQAVQILE